MSLPATIRLRASLLLGGLLLSCSPWPTLTPAPRLGQDPRLGFVMAAGTSSRDLLFNGSVTGTEVYASVYQGEGLDELTSEPEGLRFFSASLEEGVAKELPPSPLAPTRQLDFGLVLAPRGLVVLAPGARQLAFFDGAAWSTVEVPSSVPVERVSVVARSKGEIIIDDSGALFLSSGGGWTRLVPPSGVDHLALGPWDEDGLRVVFVRGEALCTALHEGAGVLGAETCVEAQARGVTQALNGTTSRFQAFVTLADHARIFQFADGAWTAGELVLNGRMVPLPGNDSVIVAFDKGPPPMLPGLEEWKNGALHRKLTDFFIARLTCECDRHVESTCDCLERDLVPLLRFPRSGVGAVLLSLTSGDLRHTVSARVLPFPFTESPFGPQCEPACAANEECVIFAGKPECLLKPKPPEVAPDAGVPLPNGSAFFHASLTTAARESPPTVTVTPLDGGAFRVLQPAPDLRLEVEPRQPYRLTVSAPGYATREEVVLGPALGATETLGTQILVRGLRLGETVSAERVAWANGHPAAGTAIVLARQDGGSQWVRLSGSPDGGARVETLAAAPETGPLHPPAFSPLGTHALLSSSTGLVAVELATGAVSSALPGEFDTFQVAFAARQPVAVVAAHSGAPTDRSSPGPVRVVSWTGSTLTSLLSISASGVNEALDRDGATLARLEGNTLARYDVAGGARVALAGTWPNATRLAFTATGRLVALAPVSSSATRCQLSTDRCALHVFEPASTTFTTPVATGVDSFGVSPQAEAVVYTVLDGAVTRVFRRELSSGMTSEVSLVPAPGASAVSLASDDFFLIGDGSGAKAIRISDGVVTATFDDRATVLTARADGTVMASNGCTGECRAGRFEPGTGAFVNIPRGSMEFRFGLSGDRRARVSGTSLTTTRFDAAGEEVDQRDAVRTLSFAPDPLSASARGFGLPCFITRVVERRMQGATLTSNLFCVP